MAKVVVFEIRIDENNEVSVNYPAILHRSETLTKEIDSFADYFTKSLEYAMKDK